MVQHYVEEVGRPDHLKLVSDSDLFTPMGRVRMHVIWELKVKRIDNQTCEFTNTIYSSPTPDLIDFLGKQGIPVEVFLAPFKPLAEAHNHVEAPLFAKNIERHALTRR